jgi:hypothetical protein
MRTGNIMIGAVKKATLKKSKLSFEKCLELTTKKLYKIENQAHNSGDPTLYESQWVNEIHSIMKKNGYYPNYKNWAYSFDDVTYS